MDNEPAVNPIPPVVIVLCLIVVLVELVLSAAAAGMIGGLQGLGWRINAMQDYAFFPAVLDRVISVGDYSMNVMKRFVTYGFVHASFTQALFAAALLLALGKFVGDVFSAGAVLLVVFGSMIFGAVVFGLIAEGNTPLLGIYPAVYGLIGAYTYLIWGVWSEPTQGISTDRFSAWSAVSVRPAVWDEPCLDRGNFGVRIRVCRVHYCRTRWLDGFGHQAA